MIVKEQSNIQVLLNCAQLGDYFKGWETIKKLPIDVKILNEIKEKAEKNKWKEIFSHETYNDMENIYKLHLLKHITKK